MSVKRPDFRKQMAKNAVYGNLYGEQHVANSPMFEGTAADLAVKNQMTTHNYRVAQYFNSPDYNYYANTLVSTGSMGREPKKIGKKTVVGTDDYNIERKPSYATSYSAEEVMSKKTEMVVVGVLVIGGLLLLTLLSNN